MPTSSPPYQRALRIIGPVNPARRRAEHEKKCLDSFKGYSEYYKIKPHVWASAGMKWHGVVSSIGCDDCSFRLVGEEPEEAEGEIIEAMRQYHRDHAKLALCEWAQLDAGWDSERVKAAIVEWDEERNYLNTDNWEVTVTRGDLSYLRKAHLELDAVVSELERFTDAFLTCDQLRDLKKINADLKRVTSNLTQDCNTANTCKLGPDHEFNDPMW